MFTGLKNLIRNTKNKATPTTDVNHENVTASHDHKHHYQETQNHEDPTTNNDGNTDQSTKEQSIPVYPELGFRYTILCQIGEGAFSKVYKARDNQLNMYVAIKVADKTHMKPSQVDSVLKEVAIMRRLDHPNIVKLYNFINTATHTFLVIEYVDGGELFNQIVKFTYFSEELSRHIIIQVVKAVDYLHSEVGVVHRDIKPENLIFQYIPLNQYKEGESPKYRKSDDSKKLDEGAFDNGAANVGQIKLADFGLSKVLWDSNTKTPCGTASYTAPEIVRDESYSKAVDMWAVGCVLYTMLSGFPPFYDTDPKVLTLKVSKGDYSFLSPWWDEISKEAKDLVSHLLTVDPLKRFTPEEVLCHPWILKNSKPTNPASDAPLYKPKNNESILKFEETIPILGTSKHHQYLGNCANGNTSQEVLLSPRAEALKFAFDTGMSIQRTATPLRRLLDNDDYFNESDDEDSDDDEDDDDSLDSSWKEADNNDGTSEYHSNDSDDDEDEEDEDLNSNHFVYTNSPVVRKFHDHNVKLTPYVKKLQTSKPSVVSSKDDVTSITPLIKQATAAKKFGLSDKTREIPKIAEKSFFKEMNSFTLNLERNTLLNRRKMSASLNHQAAI